MKKPPNKNQPQPKREPTLVERVQLLQAQFVALNKALQTELGEVRTILEAFSTKIYAMGQILGEDVIRERILQNEKDWLEAAAEKRDAALKQEVDAGTITAIETVESDAFLVLQEDGPGGEPRHPRRNHVAFVKTAEWFVKAAAGQRVGFEATGPDGTTVRILEIWRFVAPKQKETVEFPAKPEEVTEGLTDEVTLDESPEGASSEESPQ